MKWIIGLGIGLLCVAGSGIAETALRDPTEPPEWIIDPALAKLPSQLKLTAIVVTSTESAAVIDNRIVRQGDFVQGYIITKIEPNVVYLKNANGAVMVPLIPETVKSATAEDLSKGIVNP